MLNNPSPCIVNNSISLKMVVNISEVSSYSMVLFVWCFYTEQYWAVYVIFVLPPVWFFISLLFWSSCKVVIIGKMVWSCLVSRSCRLLWNCNWYFSPRAKVVKVLKEWVCNADWSHSSYCKQQSHHKQSWGLPLFNHLFFLNF